MDSLNKEELIEWRRVLKNKIKIDAITYIDTILFDIDYQKGRTHWDMIEHLCEYVTGVTFENDPSLYLCLHSKSQKITDYLDETIGLKIFNIYKEYSDRELNEYGYKLADKILKMVEPLIKNNTTYTRKIIPTKLITPSRRLTKG
jgi:hypothetical protein